MSIDGTRHNRAEEGMELQSGISQEINLQKVGGTLKVMIDRVEGKTTSAAPKPIPRFAEFATNPRLTPGDFMTSRWKSHVRKE